MLYLIFTIKKIIRPYTPNIINIAVKIKEDY